MFVLGFAAFVDTMIGSKNAKFLTTRTVAAQNKLATTGVSYLVVKVQKG